eukprot:scaffold26157_cov25-Tisochrysis_lutea.AAC.2
MAIDRARPRRQRPHEHSTSAATVPRTQQDPSGVPSAHRAMCSVRVAKSRRDSEYQDGVRRRRLRAPVQRHHRRSHQVGGRSASRHTCMEDALGLGWQVCECRIEKQEPALLPNAPFAPYFNPAALLWHQQAEVCCESQHVAIAVRRDARATTLPCDAAGHVLKPVETKTSGFLLGAQDRNGPRHQCLRFCLPLPSLPQV